MIDFDKAYEEALEMDKHYEEAERREREADERLIEKGRPAAEATIRDWLAGGITDYIQHRDALRSAYGLEDGLYAVELALNVILLERIGAETNREKRDKLMALLNEVTESARAEIDAIIEENNFNKIAGDR